MPTTQFICPDGKAISMQSCLDHCRMARRCMFLPTLRAAAKSLRRSLVSASVTELLASTRETFLKKTVDYAVRPQSVLYALHGQAVHFLHEAHTAGDMLAEIRLRDENTSGQFDLYGKILDNGDDGVLGDFKVTSAYKIMRALGHYRKDVPTGEVYRTGARKGQPKTRKELCKDGVRHVMDWALQLNMYRLLLEEQGFAVSRMVVQAMCRDYSPRKAAECGVDETLYLIPIRKISDRWVRRYFQAKAKRLKAALASGELPPPCKKKERWNDVKCRQYCAVASCCPYAEALRKREETAS